MLGTKKRSIQPIASGDTAGPIRSIADVPEFRDAKDILENLQNELTAVRAAIAAAGAASATYETRREANAVEDVLAEARGEMAQPNVLPPSHELLRKEKALVTAIERQQVALNLLRITYADTVYRVAFEQDYKKDRREWVEAALAFKAKDDQLVACVETMRKAGALPPNTAGVSNSGAPFPNCSSCGMLPRAVRLMRAGDFARDNAAILKG